MFLSNCRILILTAHKVSKYSVKLAIQIGLPNLFLMEVIYYKKC